MKKLILVKVPFDSSDYFINNVGCLRYSQDKGRMSSVVEPMEIGEYLNKDKHKILGESVVDGQKIIVIDTDYLV